MTSSRSCARCRTGTSPRCAKLGYSRDAVKGKLQITYGLTCSPEGRPVAIGVHEGNITDQQTLPGAVHTVAERFGIEHVVVVGDRGMLTQAHATTLTEQGIEFITALKAVQVRALVNSGDLQVALPTQPTGTQFYFGKADDLLDLSGTSLAGVNTDTVQLSDLLNSWQGTYLGQFSLAEIVVYATPTIADEIAWVQTSSLPNGTKQSLLAKLTNAQAALGAGHAKEAVNILNAALHYISAQAGKSIPQATATKLNDDITAIEAAIKS